MNNLHTVCVYKCLVSGTFKVGAQRIQVFGLHLYVCRESVLRLGVETNLVSQILYQNHKE